MSTKPTETGWSKFVIVDTDQGSEVWPDAADGKLAAVFAKRSDAEYFVVAMSGSHSHDDKIRNVAFNIASAFPDLNYSKKPINQNGELVSRIAQIIRAGFPPVSPSPSDFEQLLRLRKAAEAAIIALDMATFSELDATGERAKRLLREALAHQGEKS